MTLSVFIITRDASAHIQPLLGSIRDLADELIIGVDSRSVDSTEDVCRRYADQVFRLEAFGDTISITRAWMFEQCHGDWVLNLDDDELLSVKLVRALPDLMRASSVSRYWFRKRWLAWPDGERWLSGSIWSPDWQARLFRAGVGGVYTRPEAHTPCEVAGDSRFSVDGCIYHLDHLLRSPAQRLEKAQRYERSAPGNQNWDAYVLPEGVALETRPVPPDDPPWDGDTRSHETREAPVQPVSLEEMRLATARSRKPEPAPAVALPTVLPAPELFRARLACLDDVRSLPAGQPVWLTLRLQNDGPIPWGPPGTAYPGVRVTCHWLREDGQVQWFDGGRSELPCVVAPGQMEIVPLWVLPPNLPGPYRLQWELVMENVGWFSDQGWSSPVDDVYVYRAVFPLTELRARTFVRLFGVDERALDGASSPSARAARLAQLEADRQAREGTIGALVAGQAHEKRISQANDTLESLTQRLAESEADRAARLEVIEGLSRHVVGLQAECAARLGLIDRLTAHIAVVEKACSERLELIDRLTAHIRALEQQRPRRWGLRR